MPLGTGVGPLPSIVVPDALLDERHKPTGLPA
ncbi:hypothetical protein MYSE111917_22690 [Mycobacterium senriense]